MLVVLTGFIAGLLHVLSGPDHLAAVAPLAMRGHQRSWIAGVRWGLGHSVGVLLIGLLAVAFREVLPLAKISAISERLVGVVLVAIGLWSVREALRVEVHTHEHSHDGVSHGHLHFHSPSHSHKNEEGVGSHLHGHAALSIGTLHGLAGSSHFLGVLPSLTFAQRWESVAYLIAFGLGTVFAMAGFSALLGAMAARWKRGDRALYRGLLFTCAAAAFTVGCYWLISGDGAA